MINGFLTKVPTTRVMLKTIVFLLLITFQFYFCSYCSNKQKENREPAGKPVFHQIKYFRFLYIFKYKDHVLKQEWAMQFAAIVLWIIFIISYFLYRMFGLKIVFAMDALTCIYLGVTVGYIAVLVCRYQYHLYFANNTNHEHDWICEMKENFGMHPRRKGKVVAFHEKRQDKYGKQYRLGDVQCSRKLTIYHVRIYDDELLVGDITKVFRDDLEGNIQWVVF